VSCSPLSVLGVGDTWYVIFRDFLLQLWSVFTVFYSSSGQIVCCQSYFVSAVRIVLSGNEKIVNPSVYDLEWPHCIWMYSIEP